MQIGFTEIIVIIIAVLLLIDPKTLRRILQKVKSLTSKIDKNGMKEELKEMSGSLKELVEPIVDVRNDIQNLVDIRPDNNIQSDIQPDIQIVPATVSAPLDFKSPGTDSKPDIHKNEKEVSFPVLTEHEMNVIRQFHPLTGNLFHTELKDLPQLSIWGIEDSALAVAVNFETAFSYPEAGDILPKSEYPDILADARTQDINFVNQRIQSLEESINRMINIKEINIAYQIPEDKIRKAIETVWEEKNNILEIQKNMETENIRHMIKTIMEEEYKNLQKEQLFRKHHEKEQISMVVFEDDDFEENDDYF